MAKHVVKMKLEKETPGALQYKEVNSKGKVLKSDEDGALVVSQYLRKKKLAAKPEEITVTIEY